MIGGMCTRNLSLGVLLCCCCLNLSLSEIFTLPSKTTKPELSPSELKSLSSPDLSAFYPKATPKNRSTHVNFFLDYPVQKDCLLNLSVGFSPIPDFEFYVGNGIEPYGLMAPFRWLGRILTGDFWNSFSEFSARYRSVASQLYGLRWYFADSGPYLGLNFMKVFTDEPAGIAHTYYRHVSLGYRWGNGPNFDTLLELKYQTLLGLDGNPSAVEGRVEQQSYSVALGIGFY